MPIYNVWLVVLSINIMKPGTISEYMRNILTLLLYRGWRKINILILILATDPLLNFLKYEENFIIIVIGVQNYIYVFELHVFLHHSHSSVEVGRTPTFRKCTGMGCSSIRLELVLLPGRLFGSTRTVAEFIDLVRELKRALKLALTPVDNLWIRLLDWH